MDLDLHRNFRSHSDPHQNDADPQNTDMGFGKMKIIISGWRKSKKLLTCLVLNYLAIFHDQIELSYLILAVRSFAWGVHHYDGQQGQNHRQSNRVFLNHFPKGQSSKYLKEFLQRYLGSQVGKQTWFFRQIEKSKEMLLLVMFAFLW